MGIKPDMSNYGKLVLSSEKYDRNHGFGYDFRLWEIDDTAPAFLWQFPPLNEFTEEIAGKIGGKVTMAQCDAGGFVYFSRKIEDPQVVYDSFMNNLAKKQPRC